MLELIKGRRVEEALDTVAFTKKGVAPLVEKLLRSAVENANYLSQEKDLDVMWTASTSRARSPTKVRA